MQRQLEALRRVRGTWTRLPWLAAGFGHAVAQSLLHQEMVEQRQHNGRPTDWLVTTTQGLKALQLYAQLLEVQQRRKA